MVYFIKICYNNLKVLELILTLATSIRKREGVIDIRSILIVEDILEQRNFLAESANKFNSEIQIHSTDRISEALKIINTYDIGAFFIDIQLADGSGIDLAMEIRKIKKYQFTPIIFITGVRSKELEAFHEIHCYDYIIKPYTRKTITDIMSKIMVDYFDQFTEDAKYLILDFKGVKQKININDILLVESKNRRIYIRTIYEEIPYKHMNISQFAKELPDYFFQIHQSIIVNKKYIEKIDVNSHFVKLRGLSYEVPIGVSYKKRVGDHIAEVF